jgi:hypothetical protein
MDFLFSAFNQYSSSVIDQLNSSVLDDLNTNSVLDKLGGNIQINYAVAPIPPVPCFLKGTYILTVNGEKLIEDLTTDDNLITTDNRIITASNITHYIRDKTKDILPFVIPKNTTINNKKCNRDLYLSPHHGVQISENVIKQVRALPYNQVDINVDIVEYYNIILPNFFIDTVIANGIACEGLYCESNKVDKYIYETLGKQIIKHYTRYILNDNMLPRVVAIHNKTNNKKKSSNISK